MSRGLGRLQRLILEGVSEGPKQANTMRWRLWIAESNSKDMSKSFYTSFNRALGLLDNKVVRESRKLQTIGELTTYYPFKTPSLQIKRLRKALLPLVEKFVGAGAMRYSEAENEEFLFKQLSKDEKQSCQEAWQSVEHRIFGLMAMVTPERKPAMVELIVRAWQLFGLKKGISHRRSLGALIDNAFGAAAENSIEAAARQELIALFRRCFPGASLGRARLKSQLYSAFSFGKRTKPYAKEDFKEFLLREHADFVKRLVGNRAVQKLPGASKARFYVAATMQWPEMIDKIIGRDAFGEFEFLRLA